MSSSLTLRNEWEIPLQHTQSVCHLALDRLSIIYCTAMYTLYIHLNSIADSAVRQSDKDETGHSLFI